MKTRVVLVCLLGIIFAGELNAQSYIDGCLGCTYDRFTVRATDVNEDWLLRDVQHTDRYTILIIDIYALDNSRKHFFFRKTSYLTVKNLTGRVHPVKWEVEGREYPLDQALFFPKNSKGKYYRNKLYFPRIPAGYNYISYFMPNLIRWEDIYTDNLNDTRQTKLTENLLLSRLSQIHPLMVEGIYQCTKVSGEATMSNNIKIGILYNDTLLAYDVVVLNEHDFWEVGEIIAELSPTSKEGIFVANYWRNRNKVPIGQTLYAAVGQEGMVVATDNAVAEFVKLYPADSYNPLMPSGWTGTCWALGNGYLVTNYHVVEDARTIMAKGIGEDFGTGYIAEVVATDRSNDIAVLKIADHRFNGFGALPYSVTTRMADVGEDVFVLGYPLTQALGNEIKLTNGIISARTGYQGDVATYQMSAPVQPGNSGGPMFDSNGNVIGIMVAGVCSADNVGYAIKTSYLKILIESAGLNISFPNDNTISSLTLTEKVKRVRNYVFYLECSK